MGYPFFNSLYLGNDIPVDSKFTSYINIQKDNEELFSNSSSFLYQLWTSKVIL